MFPCTRTKESIIIDQNNFISTTSMSYGSQSSSGTSDREQHTRMEKVIRDELVNWEKETSTFGSRGVART